MTSPPVASRESTIAALLARSQRKSGAVPIRWVFLQRGAGRSLHPGPLASLVRRHDERALELYLLLRAVASAAPWSSTEDARVWARALGLVRSGGQYDSSAVSKAWNRLEALRLVHREREGRLASVQVLNEDGLGSPYEPPSPGVRSDWYLKLPFEYWTSDRQWYRTLNLPEKAVLLIALSLPADFTLPTERCPAWYGISADTAQRGLSGLRSGGLLRGEWRVKEAPLAPQGFTREWHYTLAPPFSGRRKAEAKAEK